MAAKIIPFPTQPDPLLAAYGRACDQIRFLTLLHLVRRSTRARLVKRLLIAGDLERAEEVSELIKADSRRARARVAP